MSLCLLETLKKTHDFFGTQEMRDHLTFSFVVMFYCSFTSLSACLPRRRDRAAPILRRGVDPSTEVSYVSWLLHGKFGPSQKSVDAADGDQINKVL